MKPTPEDIERGLTSESSVNGLISWIQRTDWTPTPEQVERGLTDRSWVARKRWIERTDYTPTPAQVERGLMDKYLMVREAWMRRIQKATCDLLSSEGEEYYTSI